jgi:caa(3)-type oxidase subunit IV
MNHDTAAHSSVKTYLFVFVGLAILTGLTVSLSYMHLPHKLGILLAALISLSKCVLIASFFMHLKSEKMGIGAFLFVGLILVAVLIAALIPDVGFIR